MQKCPFSPHYDLHQLLRNFLVVSASFEENFWLEIFEEIFMESGGVGFQKKFGIATSFCPLLNIHSGSSYFCG